MKGVREAGKQYARDHISRFSVDAVTKESKSSFTKSQATANWETYVRLMEGVDANWIEQRMAKFQIARGRGRGVVPGGEQVGRKISGFGEARRIGLDW